jgi:enamine deaminase RidA (YjgF/YER057c/UK114 family)
MKIDIRTIKAGQAAEIYITATPTPQPQGHDQVEQLFTAIAKTLRSSNARIFQERVFTTAQALEKNRSTRARIYGDLDDGVSPTWLVASEGLEGKIAGVQIHALAGCGSPQILKADNVPCGRIIRVPGMDYLTLSNICRPELSDRNSQAQAMLEKAESILELAGIDLFDVSRTWMWLDNILGWYGDFNRIRNDFFRKYNLIAENKSNKMPASTGIGLRNKNGTLCVMELIAAAGKQSSIEHFDAGGNQQSAFKYGSAFSRAVRTRTPGGITLFISGTASIAADGKTIHIGDAQSQIETTVKNVQAILEELDYTDNDVVHAIAYCKTPEVEKLFTNGWSDLPWPTIKVIADICRDDLLFEAEVTAAKSADTGAYKNIQREDNANP